MFVHIFIILAAVFFGYAFGIILDFYHTHRNRIDAMTEEEYLEYFKISVMGMNP